MAGNASSRKAKKSEPEYSLGYDADGNVVLVPNKPDTSPARSPFSRISEGAMEGYGYQPLGMSEETLAKYPTAGRYLNPVAKALDAVRRAPGAVAGGLAGTAGAGAELWTGDRGVANEAERAVKSALEYGGSQGMATAGGPRPGRAPVSGEVIPPTRGAPGQLGYTERPPVDVYRELPPGAIRGTSAERAPRVTYEEPLTRYGRTVNYDYGVKPRPPYDKKPVVDQTFIPPGQAQTVSEVTSKPSRRQILDTESPRADQQLGQAQAAQRQLTWDSYVMDNMRAADDGFGMAVSGGNVSAASPVVQLAQAKLAGRTLTPAEVGGSTSPFLTRPAPGVRRQAPAAAEPALPVRETQMAPAEYPVRSQFGVADEPGLFSGQQLLAAREGFSGPAAPSFLAQRQQIASKIAAEETRRAAEQQLLAQRQRLAGAIDEASMARPTGAGPMLQPSKGGSAIGPLGAGAAVTALGFGSQTVQDDRARQAAADATAAAIERQRIDDLDAAGASEYRAAMQQPFAGTDFFAPSPANAAPRYVDTPVGELDPKFSAAPRYTDVPVGEMDPKFAATVAAAKRQVGASRPTGSKMPETIDLTSGASKAPSGGVLSSIFNRPATTRQLFQQSVDNPDDAGAWMRAERQYAATHKDKPSFDVTKLDESGMARGGAANASPTKEALLHKSLEIIHHMIRSR